MTLLGPDPHATATAECRLCFHSVTAHVLQSPTGEWRCVATEGWTWKTGARSDQRCRCPGYVPDKEWRRRYEQEGRPYG